MKAFSNAGRGFCRVAKAVSNVGTEFCEVAKGKIAFGGPFAGLQNIVLRLEQGFADQQKEKLTFG